MNLKFQQSHLDNPLDRALLAYFFDRKGDWLDRNKAMKQCGFDDPAKQPVGAYVQFAHSVARVNHQIAYRGLAIVRDETALDFFSLQDAGYGQ